MRKLISDALTDEIVEKLLTTHPREILNRGMPWSIPPMPEVCEIISQHIPIKIGPRSYFRIETRPKGHPRHYDGCKLDLSPNHMPWCNWSAVSLLTPPDRFSGGEFMFHDPEEVYKESLYRSLLLYSSGATNNPQLHEAAPHTDGRRTMLLMFFEGENFTGETYEG
tara:strand:- start:1680 stop:2177 length:498 start_codon:yes stop_codon:yes gene_type:complete